MSAYERCQQIVVSGTSARLPACAAQTVAQKPPVVLPTVQEKHANVSVLQRSQRSTAFAGGMRQAYEGSSTRPSLRKRVVIKTARQLRALVQPERLRLVVTGVALVLVVQILVVQRVQPSSSAAASTSHGATPAPACCSWHALVAPPRRGSTRTSSCVALRKKRRWREARGSKRECAGKAVSCGCTAACAANQRPNVGGLG